MNGPQDPHDPYEEFFSFWKRVRDLFYCKHQWKTTAITDVYYNSSQRTENSIPFRRDARQECTRCGKLRKVENI